MSKRPITHIRNQGFSLIELMVAMTLGLVVLLAISTLFVSSTQSRHEISQSAGQIENGFIGMEELKRDVRMAGYFDTFDTAGLPTPASIPDICATATATLQAAIALPVQGVDNVDSVSKPTCITEDVVGGTDIVVVRRVSSCSTGDAGCDSTATRLYFQTSQCGDDTANGLPSLIVGTTPTNTAATFKLHQRNCANFAPRRRLVTHIYYVASNGDAGDGIPTLKRLELDGSTVSGWQISTLAEGVQDLQVRYGIDDVAADGIVDQYVAVPTFSSADPAVDDTRDVVTLELAMLVRNVAKSKSHVDAKAYTLFDEARGPFNDAFKRHVFTSSVRIINLAGRRES